MRKMKKVLSLAMTAAKARYTHLEKLVKLYGED